MKKTGKISCVLSLSLLVSFNLSLAKPSLTFRTETSALNKGTRISVNSEDIPAATGEPIKIKNRRSWYTYLPFFKDNSAEVILFAPRSNHSLYLSGEYQLVGHPASLIFYQPAGIICDNCNFKNVNKVIFATRQLVELSELLAGMPEGPFKTRAQIMVQNLLVNDYVKIVGDDLILSGKLTGRDARILGKHTYITDAEFDFNQLKLKTQTYYGGNNFFHGDEAQIVANGFDGNEDTFSYNNLILKLFNGNLDHPTIDSADFAVESQGSMKISGGTVVSKVATFAGTELSIGEVANETAGGDSINNLQLKADYANLNHRKQNLQSLNLTAEVINLNSDQFCLGKESNILARELSLNSRNGEVKGLALGTNKALLRGNSWQINGRLSLVPQGFMDDEIPKGTEISTDILTPQMSIEAQQLFGNGYFKIVSPRYLLVDNKLTHLAPRLNIDVDKNNFTGKFIFAGNNLLKTAENSTMVINDLDFLGDLTIVGGGLILDRVVPQNAALHLLGDKIVFNRDIDKLQLLAVNAENLYGKDLLCDIISANLTGDCDINKLKVGKYGLISADKTNIANLIANEEAEILLNATNLKLNNITSPARLFLDAKSLHGDNLFCDVINANLTGDCDIYKLAVGKYAFISADNLNISDLFANAQAKVWLDIRQKLGLNVTAAPKDLNLRAQYLNFTSATDLNNLEIADAIIPIENHTETASDLWHKIKQIAKQGAVAQAMESNGTETNSTSDTAEINAGLVVNELMQPVAEVLRPAALVFEVDQPITIDGEFTFYGKEFHNAKGLTINKPAKIVVSGNWLSQEFFIANSLIIYVGDEFKNLNNLKLQGDLLLSSDRALNYGTVNATNLEGWFRGNGTAFSGLEQSTLATMENLRLAMPEGSAYFGYVSTPGTAKGRSFDGGDASPYPEAGTKFIASSLSSQNGPVILEAAKDLVMDGTDINGTSIFLFAGGDIKQNVVRAAQPHIDHYDRVHYLERVCGRVFRVCVSHHMEDRYRWDARQEYSTKVPSIVALKGDGIITGHNIDFSGMIAALKKIIIVGNEVNLRTTIIEKNTHAALGLGIGDQVADIGSQAGARLISAKTPEEATAALTQLVNDQKALTDGSGVKVNKAIEVIPTRMISGEGIEISSEQDINFATPLIFSKGGIKAISKHGDVVGRAYLGSFLDVDNSAQNFYGIVAQPGAIFTRDKLQVAAPEGKIKFAGIYLEADELALLARDEIELTGAHETVIQHTYDRKRRLFGSSETDTWWGHSVIVPTHIVAKRVTMESAEGDLNLKGVQGEVAEGGIEGRAEGEINLMPYEVPQYYRQEKRFCGLFRPTAPKGIYNIEDRITNTFGMLRFLRPEITACNQGDCAKFGGDVAKFYNYHRNELRENALEIPTILRVSRANINFNASKVGILGSALIAEDGSVWINAGQFAINPKIATNEYRGLVGFGFYGLGNREKYQSLAGSNFVPGAILADKASINATEADISGLIIAGDVWINATNLELSGTLFKNHLEESWRHSWYESYHRFGRYTHVVPALIYGDKLYLSIDGTTRLVNSAIIGNNVTLSTERLEVDNKGANYDLSTTINEYAKLHLRSEDPTLKAFLMAQLNKLKCDNDAYLDLTKHLFHNDFVVLPALQNKQVFENWSNSRQLIEKLLVDENLSLADQRYYERLMTIFDLGNKDDFINHQIDPLSTYQLMAELVDKQLLEEDLVALDRYHMEEMYDLDEIIKVLLGNTPAINDENEIIFLKRSFGSQNTEAKIDETLKGIVAKNSLKLVDTRKVNREELMDYYQQLMAIERNIHLSPDQAGWSELNLDDERLLNAKNSYEEGAKDQQVTLRVLLALNKFLASNFKDDQASLNEIAAYLRNYLVNEAKHQRAVTLTENLQLLLHVDAQGKVLAKIQRIKPGSSVKHGENPGDNV